MIDPKVLPDASGVYCIRNLVNEKRYIGKAASSCDEGGFRIRCRAHLCQLRNGSHPNEHLKAAFRKYGEKCFTFEVIATVTDLTVLDELERYFILQFNTIDPHFGYNKTLPKVGDNSGQLSEETKARIGDALRGKRKAPEHIEKIRQMRKGMPLSQKCLDKRAETLLRKRLSQIGVVFGYWTVIGTVELPRKEPMRWLCQCRCGTVRLVAQLSLHKGTSRSCGCSRREARQPKRDVSGEVQTSLELALWKRLVSAHPQGDTLYPPWRSDFHCFLKDVGSRPGPDYHFHRLDPTLPFQPGNAEWRPRKSIARDRTSNTRLTVKGETRSLAEWAEITGLPSNTISSRLRYGWTDEAAVLTPKLRAGGRKKGE